MSYDVQHLFIGFLSAICISLVRCLLRSLACFLTWLFVSLLLSFCLFVCFLLHWAACEILVPQPEIKPTPPAMEVQSPNHWTNREAPSLLLRFKSSICILDRSPLSNVSFANTFSQAEACLLSFSWHCFSQNTSFYLMKSNLSIIPFFGVISKVIAKPKIIPRFSPMLSFGSFIVLCFTFMFMIHFELVLQKV